MKVNLGHQAPLSGADERRHVGIMSVVAAILSRVFDLIASCRDGLAMLLLIKEVWGVGIDRPRNPIVEERLLLYTRLALLHSVQ